jgi:hypothetical protein
VDVTETGIMHGLMRPSLVVRRPPKWRWMLVGNNWRSSALGFFVLRNIDYAYTSDRN